MLYIQVLCDMPSLDVSIVIIGQLHSHTDVGRPIKQPMTKDDWIQVHQDQVIQLHPNVHLLFN